MSKTLLLADDSSTIQRVVELTFAQEDIRVISVADGEQALKSIDRERPDIVLADVGMPRVDGYSVSSHVKTSATLQHIPVLLLTGAFEPVDEARAKAAKCDGVLVKPFEPRALVTRVQELLNSAHAAREAAAAAAPNGHDAAAPVEPGHAVPSWYKPERPAAADRPAPPAIDAGDLDQKLAGLTHETAASASGSPASTAPSTPPPAATPSAPPAATAAPEPLVLDLGSFTPVHGSPPLSPDAKAPEPLELAPMPLSAAAAPAAAVPELSTPPVAEPPAAAPAGSGKVSLSSAFSALLAAEQAAPAGAGAPAVADRALEDVVRRVLLNDKAVRKLVLDAAERMVKEEIERIKSESESVEGEPGTE